MNEQILPNLFSQGDEVSRILKDRRVSSYRGFIFRAIYQNMFDIKSRREFFGRLMDLQPIVEDGEFQGIRMVYKKCRMESGKWLEEMNPSDQNFGPFDQRSVTMTSFKMPDQDDKPVERMMKLSMWALFKADTSGQQEDNRLSLTFIPGL